MHLPQGQTPEHPFELATATFSVFLYGAAVHLIIHHSYRIGGSPPHAAFIVVLLIGFVFSDWSSRTRLPNLTGDTISPPTLLLKTLLEICGVYFLVSSFLVLVEHDSVLFPAVAADAIGAYSAFGGFLVVTWFWDLFMLGVMRQLKWVELASSILCGDARSRKEFKAYLAGFEDWQKTRANQIETEYKLIREAASDGKLLRILKHTAQVCGISYMGEALNANLAVLMQFLANHVAHANLIAGVAILCRETGTLRLEWSLLSRLITWCWGIDVLWPIAIAVAFLSGLVGTAAGAKWLLRSFCALSTLGSLTRLGVFGLPNGFVDDAWRATALFAVVWTLWTVPFYFLPDETQAVATSKRRAPQVFGGVLILLTLLLVYAFLPARALMILLALQQVFANVFLQLTVVPPLAAGDEHEGPSDKKPLNASAEPARA